MKNILQLLDCQFMCEQFDLYLKVSVSLNREYQGY